MKKYIILILLSISYLNFSHAQSPFQGTWKWEENGQRFYVYVLSKTLSNGYKVLRVDYKMVSVNNNAETEIYSSRFDGEFIWGGAVLSEGQTGASGHIFDQTHPETTDGIEGRFSLKILPPLNGQPRIRWKITKHSDYLRGTTTSNPPDDFNLPMEIELIKV